MNTFSDGVRLPSGDESIAPLTILDDQGHVVRVVSAAEFRRTHPRLATASSAMRRQRGGDTPRS
jgi:hypothetical protein